MFQKIVWFLFYFIIPIIFYNNSSLKSDPVPYIKLNWYRNIGSSQHFKLAENPVEFNRNYYQYKSQFFYYNSKGEVEHQLRLPPSTLISASKRYYVLYEKVGTRVSLYDAIGIRMWFLDSYTYPILSETGGSIYFFTSDQMSFFIYNSEKIEILKPTFLNSIILDYSIHNESILIGNSLGDLFLYNQNAQLIFSNSLSESKYNYIKSTFSSSTENYFGAIHGLNPEYISLFDFEGEVIWSQETFLERNKKSYVYINSDFNFLVEQGINEIFLRNLKNGNILLDMDLSHLSQEILSYIKVDFDGDKIGMGIKFPDKSLFYFMDVKGNILWEKDFNNDSILHVEIKDKNILIHTLKYIFVYEISN